MQTRYSSMMNAARQVVEHADEINATAQRVLEILHGHQGDLHAIHEQIAGRFSAIRKVLEETEADMRQRIESQLAELDLVIGNIQGAIEAAPELPEVPNG